MATFVQTNVGLYWGGYSLASSFNAIALNLGNSPQDDTVYGDTTVSNAAGLSTVQLEAEGFWQSTSDAVLQSSLGSDDTVLSVTPVDQSAGSPSLFSKVTTSTYNPISTGTVGSMLGFSLSAEGRGEKSVSGEILVIPATTHTSSSTSPVNNLGAVSATQKIYSALHVISASGTLAVTVKSASNEAFSADVTTELTHTSVGSSVTAEMLSAAGAITNTYWRVDFTISGSYQFIVSLGII
jgi:hypothetical protein